VLKVKVKVKGHVIPALSWILGMSYSVIDGLVVYPRLPSAAMLDFIESQIAPFDPPTSKTLA